MSVKGLSSQKPEWTSRMSRRVPNKEEAMSASLQQCYDMLHKTGGAFGFMASVLDKDLRDAVCVFYVVLRAMDTMEDDLTIPSDVRLTHLNSFAEHLRDPTWRFMESRDEYSLVLEQFPTVSQALRELPEKYRGIIMERGDRISKGMARFLGREMITVEDLNEYTVAVGATFCIGLGRLFAASGLEDEREAWDKRSLIEFSLFVHRINFIKDFKKDWQNGRLYWPKVITGIATIEALFNNPEVFTKSVKIPRTEAARLLLCTSSRSEVKDNFRYFTSKIMTRAGQENCKSAETRRVCLNILKHLDTLTSDISEPKRRLVSFCYMLSAVVVLLVSALFWFLVS